MFWQIEEVKEVKKELPITTLKSDDFWYYSPSTGLYISPNMNIIVYKDLSNGTYFSSVTDIEVKGNFIFWDKKIQNGKQKCRISILDLEEIDIKKLPFVPPTNIKPKTKEDGWYYIWDDNEDGVYYIYFKIINNELVAVYSQKGERIIDKTKYLETFKKTKKYKVDSMNTINLLEKKLTEYNKNLKTKEDGWYKTNILNSIFYFKSLNNELVAVFSERMDSFIDTTNYQDIFKKLDNDKINSPNLINFLQKKLTV